MEISKISDRLIFSYRYELLKDSIFAMRFRKNQFTDMMPLDQMYSLPVRVLSNRLSTQGIIL